MNKIILAIALVLCTAVPASADDLDQRTQASREVIQTFGKSLKGELQAAMKSGGPTEAIAVCKVKAPQIASELSESKGWRIARTSLRTRNSGNAPDAWERKVLEDFEARKAAGEDPKTIDYREVVDVDGRPAFRYMKAIPTQGICLTCHGAQIAPPIEAQLNTLYPEDAARGYAQGDIRGAFTIIQPM